MCSARRTHFVLLRTFHTASTTAYIPFVDYYNIFFSTTFVVAILKFHCFFFQRSHVFIVYVSNASRALRTSLCYSISILFASVSTATEQFYSKFLIRPKIINFIGTPSWSNKIRFFVIPFTVLHLYLWLCVCVCARTPDNAIEMEEPRATTNVITA